MAQLHTWHTVTERKTGEQTEAMLVPGGLVIRVTTWSMAEGASPSVALTFVPVTLPSDAGAWIDAGRRALGGN